MQLQRTEETQRYIHIYIYIRYVLPIVYSPHTGASQGHSVVVFAFFDCQCCASLLLDLTRAVRQLRVRTRVRVTCVSHFHVQIGTTHSVAMYPQNKSEVGSLIIVHTTRCTHPVPHWRSTYIENYIFIFIYISYEEKFKLYIYICIFL